jgi:hypothetical protein
MDQKHFTVKLASAKGYEKGRKKSIPSMNQSAQAVNHTIIIETGGCNE